jgi:sulfite reductase (NADPH) hemoprotein beta-component
MASKAKGPKAVTANRLTDGIVVYLTPDDRWAETPEKADWAEDETAQQQLLERAQAFAGTTVVAPYLFQVTPQADGTPRPSHIKEVMRARGPSVRPDLGKQAHWGVPADLAHAGQSEER